MVGTLVGFATSLLIETTQGTGVWGLYACPFRLFDVDDLLTNTVGALVGSLLSVLFVDRRRRQVRLPDRVALGRRWMGMLCDLVMLYPVSGAAQTAYRVWQIHGGGGVESIDATTHALVGFTVPGVLQLVSVLGRGRTFGEWTVDLRTVPRPGVPVLGARLLKFATGVVAVLALLAWQQGSSLLLWLFDLATALAAWPGRNHPGLANTVAGLRLEVDLPCTGTAAPQERCTA